MQPSFLFVKISCSVGLFLFLVSFLEELIIVLNFLAKFCSIVMFVIYKLQTVFHS